MASFLQQVTLVVQESVEWLEIILDTILASPALTVICVGVPIVSQVVRLFSRLIRL